MAPDLNSLPPSPYSLRQLSSAFSRRAPDAMAPPPVPMSPLTQSPSLVAREPTTTVMPAGDNTGVGVGPGKRSILLPEDTMTDLVTGRPSSPSKTSHGSRSTHAAGKGARSGSESPHSGAFTPSAADTFRGLYSVLCFCWSSRCHRPQLEPSHFRCKSSYSFTAASIIIQFEHPKCHHSSDYSDWGYRDKR
jgi:hypothetical protein